MFRIAHLSDIHISSPAGTLKRMWAGKRLLGGANMLLRRRFELRNNRLNAIVGHVTECAPDHVVVTGDFSTTALHEEFQASRDGLSSFIEAGKLTSIPGNHDVYTKNAEQERRYESYFADCHGETEPGTHYPFVRHLTESIVLIGVNTCVATGWFQAWGVVDQPQLKRLEKILGRYRDRTRIVLLHHYLQDRKGTVGPPARHLRNHSDLFALFAAQGAELILHGHDHARYNYSIPGPSGPIPVFNPGPSTRQSTKDENHWGGYLLYDFHDSRLEQVQAFYLDPEGTHWKSHSLSWGSI